MNANPNDGWELYEEACRLLEMAELSLHPIRAIKKAIQLFSEAAKCFADGSEKLGLCHTGRAAALFQLALLTGNPTLFSEILKACEIAMNCLREGTNEYGLCHFYLAISLAKIANQETVSKIWLENSLRSFDIALPFLREGSSDICLWHLLRASILTKLANMVKSPKHFLEDAIRSCDIAIALLPKDSNDFGKCHMIRATALEMLVGHMSDHLPPLEEAIRSYDVAISYLKGGCNDFALCHFNRANAFLRLAQYRRDPSSLLEAAIQSYNLAIPCFECGSIPFGTCHINRAGALTDLARQKRNPSPFLREAIQSYDLATVCFESGGGVFGVCHLDRARALVRLASHMQDPSSILKEAIRLCDLASPCFQDRISMFGDCYLMRGIAYEKLAPYLNNPYNGYLQALLNYDQADPCFSEAGSRLCIRSRRTSTLLTLACWSPQPEVSLGWLRRAREDAREAVDLLENTTSLIKEEGSLRRMREDYEDIFLKLAEACLRLADFQSDSEEAQLLRHEAWQAIGLSKGRSLREGMQRQSALDQQDVFQGDWEQILERFAHLNRLGGGHNDGESAMLAQNNDQKVSSSDDSGDVSSLLLNHWHRESLTLQVPPAEVPPIDLWMRSLARLQPGRTTLVADFVAFTDDSCRVLLHEAGDFGPIAAAVNLPNGLTRAAELSQYLQAALEWISHEGARNGCVRRRPDSCLRSAPPQAPYMGRLEDGHHDTMPHSIEGQFELLLEQAIELARWNELAGALASWHTDPETKQTAQTFCRRLADMLLEIRRSQPEEATRSEDDCKRLGGILGAVSPQMVRGAGLSSAHHQAFFDEAEAVMRNVPKALGELLAPLREAISARQEWKDALLVLCPTGPFHLLPLAAAEWGEPETALIERHPVVNLPTACYTEEILNRREELNNAPPNKRRAFLASTDPFGLLTHIDDEVQNAGQQLEEAGFTAECLHSSQATANRMREAVEAEVVHLAVHSGIDSHFELSGVEFHDRRLTVLELLTRVRLPHTKLAVVAACSSWKVHGDDIGADDPLALARCWSLAGANAVIGALWPLHDEAAKEFSKRLYYNLLTKRLPLAEAMQQAVVGLKNQYSSNPYAWAPYLLSGDPAITL